MTQTEALRLALNWLEKIAYVTAMDYEYQRWAREAITAIKAELEAKDEPVAWRTFDGEGGYDYRSYENNEDYADKWNKQNPKHKGWVEPLYTTPPQRTWTDLTRNEILELLNEFYAEGGRSEREIAFARVIQRALKEKNT